MQLQQHFIMNKDNRTYGQCIDEINRKHHGVVSAGYSDVF